MASDIFAESAHSRAHKPRLFARRMRPAAALTLNLLLSLGFWWAIWAMVSALILG